MRTFFLILVIATTLLSSCGSESNLSIVYPKEYFPAFPGSWWVYSNGERWTVLPDYVSHQYQPDINSTEYTTESLVPCINSQYLYEYEITQNSTRFPVKKLLTESKTADPWLVDSVNGIAIKRKTIAALDSLYLYKPWESAENDSVLFYDVVIVVEFTDTLTVEKWNIKEYYAKDIGLICTEINNPYDTLSPIVQKILLEYYIN